jgi:hypothetical protein
LLNHPTLDLLLTPHALASEIDAVGVENMPISPPAMTWISEGSRNPFRYGGRLQIGMAGEIARNLHSQLSPGPNLKQGDPLHAPS